MVYTITAVIEKYIRIYRVKKNNNVYKKLLIFFLTIFISHDIHTEENFTKEDKDELETLSRGIDNKDIANFCALLAKQTVQQIIGSNSINNLTSISNAIHEIKTVITPLGENLTVLIGDLEAVASSLTSSVNNLAALVAITNNLSIIPQLGLIHTAAASSALTTTLEVSNSNVDDYNNKITAALVAVAVAVNSPSKANTILAQDTLTIAINAFNNVLINHGNKAVLSLYSFAEIKSELAKINAELGYLYILQDS